MERPIDFSKCSIPRRHLKIPCDVEIGSNYRDLSKFKDFPIVVPSTQILAMPPKSITEQFLASVVPEDTHLDKTIYHYNTERKLPLE
jgi:hypothetical protein